MRNMSPLTALLVVALASAGAFAADCGAPALPANAVLPSPCAATATGDVCTIACQSGFALQGEGARVCSEDGRWLGQTTEGATVACVAITPCEALPCDPERSTCVNGQQGAHTCVCKDGFEGSPGTDGTGCSFVPKMEMVNGNMVFQVGPGRNVLYQLGDDVHSLSSMTALLDELDLTTTGVSEALSSLEDSLGDELASTVGELESRLELVTTNLPGQLEGLKTSLTEDTAAKYATKEDVETDIEAALTQAAAAEEQANQALDQRLRDIIEELSSNVDGNHDTHSDAIATLELAVENLIDTKADTQAVDIAISNARGVLPDNGDVGSCTAARRGQLRYNEEEDAVEYCAKDNTFKPVSFDPPGSARFAPAASCEAIKAQGYLTTTGKYWVQEEGAAAAAEHLCVFGSDDVLDLGGDGSSAGAAAHSCRTALESFAVFASGLRYIRTADGPVQTYCDMERNGGGWTLLVTSQTNDGWTASNVFRRGQASITEDFSILKYADDIKESPVVSGERFEYRIEASSFGRWGGIWNAPRHYPMASSYHFLSDIELTTKFDAWEYIDTGIEQRLPYYLGSNALLTTSVGTPGNNWWGTLVSKDQNYQPAPYLRAENPAPDIIWYFMREAALDVHNRYLVHPYGVSPDRPGESCAEIKTTAPEAAKGLGIFFIKDGQGEPTRRLCDMRKEPAQDLGGDGSSAANAAFSCNVLREHFKHEHYSFSGIYWIKPTSVAVQTYCDQTNFDGGWTLLTQSATNTGWDTANVLRRGTITSDLDTDFSILGYADAIKDAEQVSGEDCRFRMNAGSITTNGGNFRFPRAYSFVKRDNTQTSIAIEFNNNIQGFRDDGIEQRMPWLGARCGLLTTSGDNDGNWWGTLISNCDTYRPAPWFGYGPQEPGRIWYFMRENSLE